MRHIFYWGESCCAVEEEDEGSICHLNAPDTILGDGGGIVLHKSNNKFC